jgi:hypothetical protein
MDKWSIRASVLALAAAAVVGGYSINTAAQPVTSVVGYVKEITFYQCASEACSWPRIVMDLPANPSLVGCTSGTNLASDTHNTPSSRQVLSAATTALLSRKRIRMEFGAPHACRAHTVVLLAD